MRIANKLTPEIAQMTLVMSGAIATMCLKCPQAKRETHFCRSFLVPDKEKDECKACLESQRKKIFGGA